MWFSGSVAEAVDKSKKEKKLFLVFIEGNLDEILSVMQRKLLQLKLKKEVKTVNYLVKFIQFYWFLWYTESEIPESIWKLFLVF
uniref:Uncharacterized protein n=1 Tax=Tetranychus urticae TaxID=32264 RepID=A0A158P4L0_TETUR